MLVGIQGVTHNVKSEFFHSEILATVLKCKNKDEFFILSSVFMGFDVLVSRGAIKADVVN
jgi:hypothetical protein